MGTTGFLQGFLQTYGQLQQQAQQRALQAEQMAQQRELHRLQGARLKGEEAKLELEARKQQQQQAHAQELSAALMDNAQSDRAKALLLRQAALYGKESLLQQLLGGQGARGGYGKEVVYGARDGSLVGLVTTPEGTLKEAGMPEGVRLVGPGYLNQLRSVPTGTGTAIVGNTGGGGDSPRVQLEIPKHVEEESAAREYGQQTAKQAAEGPLLARKARHALDTLNLQHEELLRAGGTIDRLLALAPAAAGTYRQLGLTPLRLLLNQDKRRDMLAELQTLKANIGLEKLTDLKQSGVGLGQVTEAEHALLQNILSPINEDMTPERLRDSLLQLKTILARQKTLREQAYKADFATVNLAHPRGRAMPSSPQKSPGPLPRTNPVRGLTAEEVQQMSDEDLERLRRELGGR